MKPLASFSSAALVAVFSLTGLPALAQQSLASQGGVAFHQRERLHDHHDPLQSTDIPFYGASGDGAGGGFALYGYVGNSKSHVRDCLAAYPSYRMSDDTYQPSVGPRQRCMLD